MRHPHVNYHLIWHYYEKKDAKNFINRLIYHFDYELSLHSVRSLLMEVYDIEYRQGENVALRFLEKFDDINKRPSGDVVSYEDSLKAANIYASREHPGYSQSPDLKIDIILTERGKMLGILE